MRIKLNADYAVCLDGVHPSSFPAGSEIDMPTHIASVLLEDGRAALPSEKKMEKTALENKMLNGSPENKAAIDIPEPVIDRQIKEPVRRKRT